MVPGCVLERGVLLPWTLDRTSVGVYFSLSVTFTVYKYDVKCARAQLFREATLWTACWRWNTNPKKSTSNLTFLWLTNLSMKICELSVLKKYHAFIFSHSWSLKCILREVNLAALKYKKIYWAKSCKFKYINITGSQLIIITNNY